MLELIKKRRSIRKFTAEAVSETHEKALISAALLGPSSMGKKPVELVIIRDKATLQALTTCKSHGTTPLETATLALVVIADSQRTDVWVEDASIAALLVQMQAEALGLGSTWVQMRLRFTKDGRPSEQAVRDLLGIEPRYGVLCVVALGHKDEVKDPHSEADVQWDKVHSERF